MRSAVNTLMRKNSGKLKPANDTNFKLGHRFDVLTAFQSLETNRKMALYDLLMFGNGREPFAKTVEFLWPQSNGSDATKLEHFLRRRLNAEA